VIIMSAKTEKLLSVLKLQPVVPVLIIEDVKHAVPLARALVAGGLKAIEITMRTSAALDAIRAVADEVEGAVAGAGTILNAKHFEHDVLKFFPAEQAGGANYIKSLASPFAGTLFCPTGGISLKNAKDYLSLSNIVCVGGSWVAPKDLVAAGDWAGITRLAAEACALRD
jgi:2-dehydro-3-deoxyphosphogluconate aldolase / (4S)-4-hydroxy-2-oxoglutarate aldolase